MKTRRNSRQGSALLLTLVVTGILTLALGSYLFLVSHQFRATARSQQWNSSIPIAEAGIEDAIAHLNRNYNTNSINNNRVRDTSAGGSGWYPISSTGGTNVIEKTNSFADGSYYIVQIAGPETEYPEVFTQGFARHYGLNGTKTLFASTGGSEAPAGEGFIGRNVRAVTKLMPVYDHAIAADGDIDFSGIVETDSFNSSDDTMSTNGQYDPAKRNDKGDVATNSDINNALNLSNAKIRGRVSTGPDSTEETLQIGPNGSVGDTTHVDTGNTGVQEGFYDNDMNVDFEEVEPPFNNGGTPLLNQSIVESVITTEPRFKLCACTGYGSIPCCIPDFGDAGETGVVSVVTTATTTSTAPASGTYVGSVIPQWSSVKNSSSPPSGEYRNLEYRTKNTTSETYPAEGTYDGVVTTSVNNKGVTQYSYNEIMAYSYEYVGSYTYALITGYKRDYSIFVTNSTTIVYDYVFDSGRYEVSGLTGKILVRGHAEVYCTGDISISGQGGIWIRPSDPDDGASLTLYQAGESTDIAGQGILNETGLAQNFSYYGLPSNTDISIQGNGAFIGTIYAPQADVKLGGGGNDIQDFIGALIAKTVGINGKFQFHYDEALAEYGPSRGYRVTSWREE